MGVKVDVTVADDVAAHETVVLFNFLFYSHFYFHFNFLLSRTIVLFNFLI